MSDQEFRDKVVEGLTRLETKMCALENQNAEQSKELASVVRFQHRSLGALSVLSVVASALVSFGLTSIKTAVGAGPSR